ncbi:hypothetical protein CANCADRAFT_2269 [Tortispora caseinolytica NRRL Y-17796]|uniref:AB hydrolase-1 domain-containing protein n=1 Tax=Tortispora caseinolytica NRRL Y-17796 TaxID=767744 RepID=A0A1E4TFK6_9ASCO|nr:hypothetical protein CANCADRAFT_2269 [Tortispora caseinolytica NRRL Y-17796]
MSFIATLSKLAIYGAAFVAVTLSSGLVVLYFTQNYIIYMNNFPKDARSTVSRPSVYGLPYENVTLVTEDEVVIFSYFIYNPKSPSSHTVVMCHGNAGNMGTRIPLASQFYEMGYNVVLWSYRGYGANTGRPSEKGIKLDVAALLAALKEHQVLSKTQFVLYGQSIGGAVACHMASVEPKMFRAIVLENTFLSIQDMIPATFPLLSRFSYLCHEKWNSKALVPSFKMPALFLAGMKDEIVPPEQTRALYDLCGSPYKSFYGFPGFGHNDTCTSGDYWEKIDKFLKESLSLPSDGLNEKTAAIAA